MGDITKCFKDYSAFFTKKFEMTLFHPESPGEKVKVWRTHFEQLFKPKDFATLNECLRRKIDMIIIERTEELGKIEVYDDPERFTKVVSIEVEEDFDLDAFKAALSGVKAGDYAVSLDSYPIKNLLDNIIERTENDK